MEEIEATLGDLERDTGAQVAVVMLDDIADAEGSDAHGRFTKQLFDAWEVGQKHVNNGVVIASYSAARRIEIKTGRGVMDDLPDWWL